MQKIFSLCVVILFNLIMSEIQTANSSSLGEKIQSSFERQELEGLHGFLLYKDGKIHTEKYFSGPDQNWGTDLGHRTFSPDALHDLRSVTKSIVSLLYGIALNDGLVPSPEDVLLKHFSQYSDLQSDEERTGIRVRHVLSMKMGTEWNEDVPYSNPDNSEVAMEKATDRYRYILDRPMINTPGDYWVYNGGATAIIAKLIADGSGMRIDEYAEQKLFKPLGIQKYEWAKGHDGIPSAASGLRLSARDLLKIGQLILNYGLYRDKQVIPKKWLEESFKPKSQLQSGLRYGYFWWLAPQASPPLWVAGFGNGGQRLVVNHRANMILVVQAGNYNKPNNWKLPVKLLTDFILPELFPDPSR